MNNFINFLAENWYLIITVICALAVAGVTVYSFIKTPKSSQLAKVQEWLLQAVIECEKKLGEKTGAAKLSMAYDMFVARFPAVASVLSFETFSKLVDAALEKMRNMLQSNKSLQEYVYGQTDGENNG